MQVGNTNALQLEVTTAMQLEGSTSMQSDGSTAMQLDGGTAMQQKSESSNGQSAVRLSDMTRRVVALGALLLAASTVASVRLTTAQSCEPTSTRHAFATQGEVAGEHEFGTVVNDRWTFLLDRNSFGWSIRMYDSTGVDLTAITPPFHFGVNHRDIEGWHFRNQNNTGPNDGSVNAPQTMRLFVFSPALEGTGGFRPPDDDVIAFDGTEGRGSLTIHDMGLADLEQGQRARLNYLRFSACLTWPKSADAIAAEEAYNDLDYIDEEKEIMFGCGLRMDYELSAWMKPRWLQGDFDGDDAIDDVAQIRRKSDGRRGIAICRAGTWATVFGMDGEMADDLPENGFGAFEAWSLTTADRLANNELLDLEGVRQASGDILKLDRIEKSMHAVYWLASGSKGDGAFRADTLFRLVTE
ncbi:MAG: hypothetical protein KDD65_12205 [Bacteroidetes bacterium]|nr:hypothetical protein [Bacteroidota bacterium]